MEKSHIIDLIAKSFKSRFAHQSKQPNYHKMATVVFLRFVENKILDEIGREVGGIQKERVRHIETRALNCIYKEMRIESRPEGREELKSIFFKYVQMLENKFILEKAVNEANKRTIVDSLDVRCINPQGTRTSVYYEPCLPRKGLF